MRKWTAYSCILLAAFCWGLIGTITRFAMEDGVTSMQICFWRMLFSTFLFMGHAVATNVWKLQSVKDLGYLCLFGIFGGAIFYLSFFWTTEHGSVALAVVLMYTCPVWVAITARIIHKVPITPRKLLAIGSALLGVACMSFSSGGTVTITVPVILVGLLAGITFSTHFVFLKILLKRYTTVTIYAYVMLFGTIALLPFADFGPMSFRNWMIIAGLAFFSTYIGYGVYSYGVRYVESTKASIIVNIEPIVAIVAAWLVWGEVFSLLGWVGAVFVLSAVLLLVLGQQQEATDT